MKKPSRTALLIDDSLGDRETVRGFLSEDPDYSYQVLEAVSGEQGLELCRQYHPDCVILEYRLPDLTGLEFLQQLLQEREQPACALVMLTGTGNTTIAVEALKRGAHDYLEKGGLNAQQLRRSVNSVLERVHLQCQLNEQREWFRVTLASIGDGVIATDATGCVTFMNAVAEELSGWLKHDALGRSLEEVFEIIRESTREKIENPVAKVIRTGNIVGLANNTILLAKDGRELIIGDSGAPIRDQQGRIIGVVLVFRDLSKQYEVEKERRLALQREQQRNEQLRHLAAASLAIHSQTGWEDALAVITEKAREIIGAHQAIACLNLNQNRGQAINAVSFSEKYAAWRNKEISPAGSRLYGLASNRNQPLRLTQAELEAHAAWRNPGPAAHKHLPLRGYLAAPLVGRDGQHLGLLQLSDKYEAEFTTEDEAILVQLAQMASISLENMRLLKDEQSARATAEAANRSKDEFLTVVSHELRSPLNAMLGYTRLLRSGQTDPETLHHATEVIERNARLQLQLIEDLLDTARIISGKLRLEVEPVDLIPVIQAALDVVRPAAQAKNIEIQTYFDLKTEQITGDPERLQQIVWNLLSNAIKFTPKGGHVALRLERDDPHVRLTVSDTGKGIAPDFLPHVFDRFSQSDSSSSRRHGGLGLGLALVKYLVELHGGTAWVESKGEGQGARFFVNLPLRAVRSETPLLRTPRYSRGEINAGTLLPLENHVSLAGVKVLVLDDQEEARELVKAALELYGARVLTAATGTEMFKLLETAHDGQRPDVLVCDVSMPGEDGYSVIRQVRRLEQTRGIAPKAQLPAIALTAHARMEDRLRALQAGFHMHVAKPVEPEELAVVIHSLLNQFSHRVRPAAR